MQLWSEYMDDYLKPTEDMIARYKARGVMKDCSSDSRDVGGNCVPFDSFNTAMRDNNESCENMKDMLEQTPEEIADQIISARTNPRGNLPSDARGPPRTR